LETVLGVPVLLGAPPGYVGYEEGGVLTGEGPPRPYSVVLFDEIEKAHPDISTLLLPGAGRRALERTRSARGRLKNAILIMTSNLGTSLIGKRTSPGFLQESDPENYEKMKGRVMEELKRASDRSSSTARRHIVFHALALDHIKSIVRLRNSGRKARLSSSMTRPSSSR